MYEKHGTTIKTIRKVESALLVASTIVTTYIYFNAVNYYDERPLEDYGCVPSKIIPDKYMCSGEEYLEIYNNTAYWNFHSGLTISSSIAGLLLVTGSVEHIAYRIDKRKNK